jgi:TRAP-type C4-dicarboxylate transport system substrate-binding protein
VYSRACLSRTVVIVVALLFTAASANAVAREFRVADTQSENYPTIEALRFMGRLTAERSGGRNQIRVFHSRQKALEQRSRSQAEGVGATIVTGLNRKPFEAAMAGIYGKAQRDPAVAELISRIRKVE